MKPELVVENVREFVDVATDDELVNRILKLMDREHSYKQRIADLESELDKAHSTAERAISYGTAVFEKQTAPVFALAIRNEIFRSLRIYIKKHGDIKEENFPKIAANLAFRMFRTLALFGVKIDQKGQPTE
jgi:hypothetical protein